MAELGNASVALIASVVLALAAALVLAAMGAVEMFGGYVTRWPIAARFAPARDVEREAMVAREAMYQVLSDRTSSPTLN